MGLCGKVTLTLLIIVFIQISCRRCMPRTPTKASLKQYLNNLTSVKNNPTSLQTKTSKSIFENNGKNANTARNSRSFSNYDASKFPKVEYPQDTSAKDPFNYRMNANMKYQANKQKEIQNSAVNDLKKKIKMQRKLSSYIQFNEDNYQSKRDMSRSNYVSSPDSMTFLDSAKFPEVQYPGNVMDTWGPNYWNYLSFTQDKQQFDGFGQQYFFPKGTEDTKVPLTKLSKAKAYQYLRPYHELKEEHRRVSSDSYKRSSLDEKGIHITKAPICEKLLEDFITEGIVSSISSDSSDAKDMLKSIIEMTPSSNTTCLKESVLIPYRAHRKDTSNFSHVHEEENNSKINDLTGNYVGQFPDDICIKEPNISAPGNININKTMHTLDHNLTSIPSAIAVTDSAKSHINASAEALLTLNPDDQRRDILPNQTLLVEQKLKNTPTNSISFAEPVAPNNVAISQPGSTSVPLANVQTIPGTTSIIIIPINNAAGIPQSQFFETKADGSIVVYLPTSTASDVPAQYLPVNQTASSLEQVIHNFSQTPLEKHMSYNNHNNVVSDMVPVQNNIISTPNFLSEISMSVSPQQKYESMPSNSMCYKDVKNTSSLMGISSSDNINITLTDTLSSGTPACDENLPVINSPLKILISDKNSEILPSFYNGDFSLLSDGPHNSNLINEMPIIPYDLSHANNSTSEPIIRNHYPENNLDAIHNNNQSILTNNGLLNEIPYSSVKLLTDSTPGSTTTLDPRMNGLSVPIDTIEPLIPLLSKAYSENISPMHEVFTETEPTVTTTKKLAQTTDKIHTPSTSAEYPTDKLPLDETDPNISWKLLPTTTSENLSLHKTPLSLSKTLSEDFQLVVDFPEQINQSTGSYMNAELVQKTLNKSFSETPPSKSETSENVQFIPTSQYNNHGEAMDPTLAPTIPTVFHTHTDKSPISIENITSTMPDMLTDHQSQTQTQSPTPLLPEVKNVDVFTDDIPLQENNLSPPFVNPHNNLNQSETSNSDLESNNSPLMPIGLIQTPENEDHPLNNMSLQNESASIEGPFLSMDKIIGIPSRDSPLQKVDTQVMDHKDEDLLLNNITLHDESTPINDSLLTMDSSSRNPPLQKDDIQVQNITFEDILIDSQSLSNDTTSPVNDVLPPLLSSNTSINSILVPVDGAFSETPLLNTETVNQPLEDDSTSPYDQSLLDILSTDSPETSPLTDMNHSSPILDGEGLSESPSASDFNNTFLNQSVANMTSDLRTDNEQQSLLSNIDDSGQSLDDATSKSFKRDLSVLL